MCFSHHGPGKTQPVRKADNLTVICEPIAWTMWSPRYLITLWPSAASNRDSLTFYFMKSVRENKNDR
jgi:hypothetical protein